MAFAACHKDAWDSSHLRQLPPAFVQWDRQDTSPALSCRPGTLCGQGVEVKQIQQDGRKWQLTIDRKAIAWSCVKSRAPEERRKCETQAQFPEIHIHKNKPQSDSEEHVFIHRHTVHYPAASNGSDRTAQTPGLYSMDNVELCSPAWHSPGRQQPHVTPALKEQVPP